MTAVCNLDHGNSRFDMPPNGHDKKQIVPATQRADLSFHKSCEDQEGDSTVSETVRQVSAEGKGSVEATGRETTF